MHVRLSALLIISPGPSRKGLQYRCRERWFLSCLLLSEGLIDGSAIMIESSRLASLLPFS